MITFPLIMLVLNTFFFCTFFEEQQELLYAVVRVVFPVGIAHISMPPVSGFDFWFPENQPACTAPETWPQRAAQTRTRRLRVSDGREQHGARSPDLALRTLPPQSFQGPASSGSVAWRAWDPA